MTSDDAYTLAEEIFKACPNYGSEHCTCGTHGTPATDCPVHWAIVVIERRGLDYTSLLVAGRGGDL